MNSIVCSGQSQVIQEKLVKQINIRVKAMKQIQKGQYKDFGIMEQRKAIEIVTRDDRDDFDYKFAQWS